MRLENLEVQPDAHDRIEPILIILKENVLNVGVSATQRLAQRVDRLVQIAARGFRLSVTPEDVDQDIFGNRRHPCVQSSISGSPVPLGRSTRRSTGLAEKREMVPRQ